MSNLQHFKKVSDYHNLVQLPAPEHPLISVVDYSKVRYPEDISKLRWQQDYYTIGLKRYIPYKLFYGQQDYDFDEGIMTFVAPQQVMSLASNPNLSYKHDPSGWLLLIHPDFLWNTPLAQNIKRYSFFGYSVNEALFLSEKEETLILEILKNIQREYQANIDQFSQKIIVSQIELLLNYAERFYERQFITRKISNHRILNKLEELLSNTINTDLGDISIPTVQWIADQLHLSPNYLSSLLKSLTGLTTQQHIQEKLIETAKTQLSISSLSVSEIAYQLGFEHPASFTKLFKSKTKMTPLQFRKAFN